MTCHGWSTNVVDRCFNVHFYKLIELTRVTGRSNEVTHKFLLERFRMYEERGEHGMFSAKLDLHRGRFFRDVHRSEAQRPVVRSQTLAGFWSRCTVELGTWRAQITEGVSSGVGGWRGWQRERDADVSTDSRKQFISIKFLRLATTKCKERGDKLEEDHVGEEPEFMPNCRNAHH